MSERARCMDVQQHAPLVCGRTSPRLTMLEGFFPGPSTGALFAPFFPEAGLAALAVALFVSLLGCAPSPCAAAAAASAAAASAMRARASRRFRISLHLRTRARKSDGGVLLSPIDAKCPQASAITVSNGSFPLALALAWSFACR